MIEGPDVQFTSETEISRRRIIVQNPNFTDVKSKVRPEGVPCNPVTIQPEGMKGIK